MSYIDIAIIVLVALFGLIGLKQGFFKSVVAFFGWFLSMVIAVLLTKVVAYALLDIKAIGNFVCGGEGFSLYNWIVGFLPEKGTESGFLATLLAPIYSKVAGYSGLGALGDVASRQAAALMVAYGIFTVIVCLGLFIVIRIVMMLFTMFVKSFSKDDRPGGVSRLLGFLIGAVRGFAYSALILMVMGYALAIPQLGGVGDQLEKSVIGKPVQTLMQKMTDKLFTGKDEETINKLSSIAGIDFSQVDEELDGESDNEENVGGGENGSGENGNEGEENVGGENQNPDGGENGGGE